jgi:pyruvate/2-oxoglutarate dehydrogenase complex dihydrolipoamide acyltransferase (E2) component
MKLRSDYKDEFVTKHGVKLGLMSCFVKVFASLRRCKAFAPYFYVAG